MGTAILTSLNAMTNPPSDLNEITTGWKFFKKTVNVPSQTKEFAYPRSNITWTYSTFNADFDPITITDFLPKNISGAAVMIKNNITSSTSTPATVFPIKAWPSNPTTDNILNTTNAPLTIIFDSVESTITSATPNSGSVSGMIAMTTIRQGTDSRDPKYIVYGVLRSSCVISKDALIITYKCVGAKHTFRIFDYNDDSYITYYHPDQTALGVSGQTIDYKQTGTYSITVPALTTEIYGWYLPA